MGLVSFAISNVFQILADEVSALGALGPIDYIDYKANNISLKVDEVVENIEDWLDTSTPEKKDMHPDISQEASFTETGASEMPTLTSIAVSLMGKWDEITDTLDRWWAKEHHLEDISEVALDNALVKVDYDYIYMDMDTAEKLFEENGKKDALSEAVTGFFNERIPTLKEMIAETAKKFDASKYDHQLEYLQDIFDFASVKCWNYMKSEVEEARDEVRADLSLFDMITEESVKENVILIATAMFADMAAESLTADEG